MQQQDQNPYAVNDGISLDVSDRAGELAGRWIRFAASLIDGVILAALIWPVLIFGFGLSFQTLATLGFGAKLLVVAGGFLCYVLVNGYLLHKSGQTVGKKLLGIRVVMLDGSPASLVTLTVMRQLSMQLLTLIPIAGSFAGLLDALFIFGKNRRCLHDLIAGTKVVLA